MTQDEIRLLERFLITQNLPENVSRALYKLIASYRVLSIALDEFITRFDSARSYAQELRMTLSNIFEMAIDPTGIIVEKCNICGNDSLQHKRDCPALDLERVLMLNSDL